MVLRLIIFTLALMFAVSALSALTIQQAELVQSRLIKIYSDHQINKGFNIEFINHWNSKNTGAFSRRISEIKSRYIEVHGALLGSSINEDGFAFLVCHELGHQFGGKPFIHPEYSMSAEGQSDYFASLDCAKRYFGAYPGLKMSRASKYKEVCSKQIKNIKNKMICEKVLLAGENFLRSQEELENGFSNISYETKSVEQPNETLIGFEYPSYQCRLDTIAKGAACPLWPSNNESVIQDCATSKRPKCWFNTD